MAVVAVVDNRMYRRNMAVVWDKVVAGDNQVVAGSQVVAGMVALLGNQRCNSALVPRNLLSYIPQYRP